MEAGFADDADDAIVGRDIDHEGIGDQSKPGGVAEVVGGVNVGRHVHLDDEHARLGALYRDRLDLGLLEQFVPQHGGKLAAWRGLGGERGDLRRSQPFHQPLPTEVGHRGHEHEHLGEHDEQDSKQQQLGGQPGHIAGCSPSSPLCAQSFVLHVKHSS